MSPYAYITKLSVVSSLAYRFEVFAATVSNFILLLTTVYLWKAAYRGVHAVAGVNQQQMMTYTIMSALLGSIFVTRVQGVMFFKVRQGQIAMDFIRPLSPLAQWFFEDIGGSITALAMYLAPLLVASVAFIQIPRPASPAAFVIFFVSALLSYVILWLMSGIMGCIAFWVTDLGNLGIIKNYVVRIFSGSFVPIWFFPEPFRVISRYLPFQYTYQTPLGIFVGRITPVDAIPQMALQAVWIGILGACLTSLWRNGYRRVSIQGG
ncbi:MAG: ABC transporter permease [Capsulimonadaceae bacterium]